MQILEVSNLKPGGEFAQPLFHKSGRKLLAVHTTLTQLHIDALAHTGVKQVYLAPSAEPVLELASAQSHPIPITELHIGTTVETDVMTPDGVVIIQQNEQVEEHHIAALRDSNISYVFAKPPIDMDAARHTLEAMARVVTGRLEGMIRRGEYMIAREAVDPFLREIPSQGGSEALNLNAIQLMRRRLSSRLQPLYGRLETGNSPDHQPLEDIATDLLDLMKAEPKQFTQLATMTARREDYLPDHAISVAVLAMAIAAHVNLAKDMVRQVILGALLFDVGMLMVPRRIRMSSGVLTDADRQRVKAHPLYSVTMMEQISGLSPIPRMMGYQHHERLTGRGYPTGAAGAAVSEYARILAIADIFAASVNPRIYKSAKLPYNAMEELVIMAHKGMLDTRVVKALLSAVGLFPVGSFVILSNQKTAQVVGANASRIDRPVVRVLEAGEPFGPLIDLSDARVAHFKIVKAVPAPMAVAERIAV